MNNYNPTSNICLFSINIGPKNPLFLLKHLIDSLVLLISDNDGERKIHCIKSIAVNDWRSMLELCNQNYLTSYFYSILKKEKLFDFLPTETQNILEVENKKFILRSLKVRGVFLQVIRWLKEADIDFVVLKGCDIQNRLYDNPALRRMIDIDILIHPEYLDRITRKVILNGGNKLDVSESEFIDLLKHHEAPLMYKNVAIEFHKSLVDKYEISDLASIDVWDYSESFMLDGIKVKVMQPEMLIVYLCHHLHSTIQGGKIKLFWYLDIYLFFNKWGSKIEERKLAEILNNSKEREIFYHVLSQVKSIFPYIRFPEFIVVEDAAKIRPEVYAAVQSKYVIKPMPHYYVKFKNVGNLKSKIKFLFDKIFPSKRYIINTYKTGNVVHFIGCYILHQIMLVFKGVQAVIYYFYRKI